ncbi:GTP 3',8-cyclase MoaA [Thermotoga profunda]|uniref:GTP 3',8-cyclase MoaA n=1 Tax=Thermotoga profunda TaxID=1508420 RepID=UPI000597ACBC|nr:GTP 3',8-cyclase MoaA [Thermotoga profunda]
MLDKYNRKIDYLRFSITDRCNHRCFYCIPLDTKFLPFDNLLTTDEINILAQIFSGIGIQQVRITGGEPLLREDVVDITRKLSKYFRISMTTNGSRLRELAESLKEAGLVSVNISLNSLKEDVFFRITKGQLKPVLAGIDAAIKCGLFVKINTVVSQLNLNELPELVDFVSKRGIPIRFIEMMPIGRQNKGTIFEDQILEKLSDFDLKPVQIKIGQGPARYFITKHGNYVGIISAMSRSFCKSCNKLRLSCDGKLYPCLGSTYYVDVLEKLRSQQVEQLSELVKIAIYNKPLSHNMKDSTVPNTMNRLGG